MGRYLQDGFTECQLYEMFQRLGGLKWTQEFYRGAVTIEDKDIPQMENWIKGHPERCEQCAQKGNDITG